MVMARWKRGTVVVVGGSIGERWRGVEGLGRGNGRFSARRAVRADAVEGYDDDDRTARVARIV